MPAISGMGPRPGGRKLGAEADQCDPDSTLSGAARRAPSRTIGRQTESGAALNPLSLGRPALPRHRRRVQELVAASSASASLNSSTQ
jgi:hypothetical protein